MNCNKCGVDVTGLKEFIHESKRFCEWCYNKYVLGKIKPNCDSWTGDKIK